MLLYNIDNFHRNYQETSLFYIYTGIHTSKNNT